MDRPVQRHSLRFSHVLLYCVPTYTPLWINLQSVISKTVFSKSGKVDQSRWEREKSPESVESHQKPQSQQSGKLDCESAPFKTQAEGSRDRCRTVDIHAWGIFMLGHAQGRVLRLFLNVETPQINGICRPTCLHCRIFASSGRNNM